MAKRSGTSEKRDWGHEYYQVSLEGLQQFDFSQKVFRRCSALVTKQPVEGYYEEVERAEHIRVRFLDRHGEEVEMEAEGLLAVCIQLERDHLEGKLFVDYLSEA